MVINKKVIVLGVALLLVFGFLVSAVKVDEQEKTRAIGQINYIENKFFDNKNENNAELSRPVMESKPSMDEKYYEIPQYVEEPTATGSFDDIPNQFSWKDYGGDWTTPARDQGNCGSCYIFAALGAFEGAINIASGSPDTDIDLSEQYCLSCVNAGNYGCSGGLGNTIIEAIYSTDSGQYGNNINGCPIESCMSYQADDSIPCSDKCDDWDYYTEPPQPDNKLWQISSWGWTDSLSEDNPSDWDFLKNWVLEHGPLCVDIYASSSFQNWGNTHNDPDDVYEQDDPGTTNHEVTLVGWKDDPNIMNGGYWIVKNSWGQSWGYNGFFNIAYGCNSFAEDIAAWIDAVEWPGGEEGPGPVDPDMAVFADFDYMTEEN
ncbi:MAG: C1 family peptidase, partial [Candidatus Thermoplasmatota archaeon]